MVATLVLGTSAEGRAGSSPASGTKTEAVVRDTSCMGARTLEVRILLPRIRGW